MDRKNYKTEDLYPAMLDFAKKGCFYSIITDFPIWSDCIRRYGSGHNCLLAKQGQMTTWWKDDVWNPSLEHNLYMGNCFCSENDGYLFIDKIRKYAEPYVVKEPDEIKMGHRIEPNYSHYMTIYLHSGEEGKEYFISGEVHSTDYCNLLKTETFNEYKSTILQCCREGLLFDTKEDADKVASYAQELLEDNANIYFQYTVEPTSQNIYDAFMSLSEETDEEKAILPLSIIAKNNDHALKRVMNYIFEHYSNPKNEFRLKQWFTLSLNKDILATAQHTIDVDLLPLLEEYDLDGFSFSYTVPEEAFLKMRRSVMAFKEQHGEYPYDEDDISETFGDVYNVISDEIETLLEQEQDKFLCNLSNNINKIRIWDTDAWESYDEWFEQTVIDIIEYKYANTDEINIDDLMSDLEDYIYPDEQDYEDPEEYEERLEQLESYNEQDQHQIITAKAARRTAKRILQFREDMLKVIKDFIEDPYFECSETPETLIEEAIEKTIIEDC